VKTTKLALVGLLLPLIMAMGCATHVAPATRNADSAATVSEKPAAPPLPDVAIIRRIHELIRTRHMTTDASDAELYYGAMRGYVQALGDPFSVFLDPKSAALSRESMAGKSTGIGVVLKVKEGHLTVMSTISGSPAEKAGIKTGDVIVAIDGASVDGMTVAVVATHVRGAPGTPITLKIERPGTAQPIEIAMIRKEIYVPSVTWTLKQAHGKVLLHVVVSKFGDDSGRLFEKALEAGRRSNVAGIILDLRDDTGGRSDMAGTVTCHWIAHQPYVNYVYRDRRRETKMCDNDEAPLGTMPTVVLVNERSASASELTAGALQDFGRARIIGETTFGKGCGQSVTEFPDGSRLILVTFLWYTPKGRSIHKVGITPDEIVKNDPTEIEKGHDAQLERAKEFLSTGR
jgi:carboxyl-terminal processing protease